MFGTISEEIQVKVAASEAWKVYGTLQLATLVEEKLSHVDKIEVVEGDGNAGTILKCILSQGQPGFEFYKEKFTVVDHEKRVKVAKLIEGGYLHLGFTLYQVRFEIIEDGENSCIIKSTVEYEINEESAIHASIITIQPLVDIMNIVAQYLTKG